MTIQVIPLEEMSIYSNSARLDDFDGKEDFRVRRLPRDVELEDALWRWRVVAGGAEHPKGGLKAHGQSADPAAASSCAAPATHSSP